MEVLLRAVCYLTLFGLYLAADDLFVLVPETSSLPECPPNEMFKYCLNNCTNCEQRGVCCSRKERGICMAMDCTHNGCDCIPQFVRLRPDGPCEHVSKCPIPKCGENERFRECGPVFEHCSFFHSKSVQCDHKCYCNEGYKRSDEDNKCIPKDECPPKSHCFRNEELLDEGPVDQYCIHEEFEDVNNFTMNKTSCYCKDGFKRNSFGRCTRINYCQNSCFNGEVYQNCPRACNTTCWSYADPDCKEDGQCFPGCFCPEGLLMNHFRRCVTPDKCPPGSNPFAPTAAPEVEVTIPESVNSSSLEEIETTTPSGDLNSENTEATSKTDSVESETDKVVTEEVETTQEEDVTKIATEMVEGLQDEDIEISTQEPAKTPPTKRSRNQKSQPSQSSKGGLNVFTRTSAKSEKAKPLPVEDDEFSENDWL